MKLFYLSPFFDRKYRQYLQNKTDPSLVENKAVSSMARIPTSITKIYLIEIRTAMTVLMHSYNNDIAEVL